MAPLQHQTSVSSARGILEKTHILKDLSFWWNFYFSNQTYFGPKSDFYHDFPQFLDFTRIATKLLPRPLFKHSFFFFQTRVKSQNLPRWVPCDWNNLIFWNIPVFLWNLYFSNVTYLAPKSDFYHAFPQFLAFASIATKSFPTPLFKHSKVSN